MTAYRFCRTDDMGLLVAAYETCRGPEDATTPPLDRSGLKDLVREQDLWCSSCMVALEGREPVGVLLGAKRAEATLVYGLRVTPAHRRRGHGRHLLTSLGKKLAILGPERLVAEVPAERTAARALFAAAGWQTEAQLVDWLRPSSTPIRSSTPARDAVAPIVLGDLLQAGLVGPRAPATGQACKADGTGTSTRCWHRDLPALMRLEPDLAGVGFHSQERLEAWLLYRPGRAEPLSNTPGSVGAGFKPALPVPSANAPLEILAAGYVPGDLGRLGLTVLVEELARSVPGTPLSISRVSPDELDAGLLAEMGFEPGPEHLLVSTRAQAA